MGSVNNGSINNGSVNNAFDLIGTSNARGGIPRPLGCAPSRAFREGATTNSRIEGLVMGSVNWLVVQFELALKGPGFSRAVSAVFSLRL